MIETKRKNVELVENSFTTPVLHISKSWYVDFFVVSPDGRRRRKRYYISNDLPLHSTLPPLSDSRRERIPVLITKTALALQKQETVTYDLCWLKQHRATLGDRSDSNPKRLKHGRMEIRRSLLPTPIRQMNACVESTTEWFSRTTRRPMLQKPLLHGNSPVSSGG